MSSPRPRIRRIEVLLIVITLAVAVGWFVGFVPANRYHNRPSVCKTNLRCITTAMYLYAEEGDSFPMSTDMSRAGEMSMFANRDRPPPPGGPPSPTADIWMVLRNNNATPKMFICPSTVDTHDPAEDTTIFYDFADRKHLSYSYVYQYHPQRQPIGYQSSPGLAMLADSNPYLKGGVPETAAIDRRSSRGGNSRNHRSRDGQNVAFVDGHVEYMTNPRNLHSPSGPYVAANGPADNIYTTHADNEPSDPGNAPTWTRIQIGSKSDYCLMP